MPILTNLNRPEYYDDFDPNNNYYRTLFKAGSGKLLNEHGDTPDAKFNISMKAGSGDLIIKKIKN